MGVLFGVKENTITYHIKEILASGELEGVPTTRKFRVVRLEGKRQVSRQIDFYNLEMVISVGYRVVSLVSVAALAEEAQTAVQLWDGGPYWATINVG